MRTLTHTHLTFQQRSGRLFQSLMVLGPEIAWVLLLTAALSLLKCLTAIIEGKRALIGQSCFGFENRICLLMGLSSCLLLSHYTIVICNHAPPTFWGFDFLFSLPLYNPQTARAVSCFSHNSLLPQSVIILLHFPFCL